MDDRLPVESLTGIANGGTLGFASPTRDAVHKFHEAGLANGGTDEGEPGPRTFTPTAYAAYLRDPDGNKVCTYLFRRGISLYRPIRLVGSRHMSYMELFGMPLLVR